MKIKVRRNGRTDRKHNEVKALVKWTTNQHWLVKPKRAERMTDPVELIQSTNVDWAFSKVFKNELKTNKKRRLVVTDPLTSEKTAHKKNLKKEKIAKV